MDISAENLSARERMVAERFARGDTYKEVAASLCIAPSTVRAHLASIYRKLGVNNKAALVSTLSNDPADSVMPTFAMTNRPSIAVLPFANISSDAENTYFVEGMTEEITTGLCRFREIVVTARGSSILARELAADPGEAASKLGVDYVLSGSVQRVGNRVRITASLIEGKTGRQIWSDQYDHLLDDIFKVQDEVAQKIVTMLVGNIERTNREHSLRKHTDELSAYECVLQGRYYFHEWRGSEDDVRFARELFEKAIEIDPRYPAAYAGLAATYLEEFDHEWSSHPEVTGAKCIELAKKAIELDEQDGFAHLVLSNAIWLVESHFELARIHLETAIELNPNYYWSYCYGCWFSLCNGKLDLSVIHANEAIRRNPLLPDNCLQTLGFSEYLLKRYDEAIATFGKIAEPEPVCCTCLVACYAQLDRTEETKQAAAHLIDHFGIGAMDESEWNSYWRKNLNFQDQRPVDHLIEGLAKAGLVAH